jgi:competence protein ComEC
MTSAFATRLVPAHVVLAAFALGLALANAVRFDRSVETLGCVSVAVVVVWCYVPRDARFVSVAVLFGLGGWVWGSARLDALDHSLLRPDVGRAGRVIAVVTGEPRVGTFAQRVPVRVRSFEGRPVDERAQLDLALARAPPQGSIVSVLAVVRLPRSGDGGFDERTWLRRQGVHVVLQVDEWHTIGKRGGLAGAADRLRAWLRRTSTPGLTGERRAVLQGVVLGDDAGLSDGLKRRFRRSGLYHLLAVSGQNVVLLAAGVLGLAWLVGVPRTGAHVAAIAGIAAYVAAVGPQPSVIRAAVSGMAVSVAWLASRERDSWHVLLLAAVVLLGWNRYAIFDAGFQLSFAAVVAIFVAVRPTLRVLEGYPVPRRLAAVATVSAVCSVATAPILWLQFGQVPLLGVVANALVEPVVGLLLGLALTSAAVDPVAPFLAHGLAWVNGWLAAYTASCAGMVAALPFAQASGRAAAIAGVGSLVLAAYAWSRWRTSSNRST